MRTFRRSLIVYALLFLSSTTLTIISSCSLVCTHTCCGSEDYEPRNHRQLVNTIAKAVHHDADDYYIQERYLTDGEEVRANQFRIEVTLHTLEVASKRRFSNPFMNTAYACSLIPPYLDFGGTIQEVTIVSDNDFNDQYKAGDNLMDLFDFDGNPNYNNVNEAHRKNDVGDYAHTFHLVSSPTANSTYRFTVKYRMSSGEVFESTTVQMRLRQ